MFNLLFDDISQHKKKNMKTVFNIYNINVLDIIISNTAVS